jgi:hypothetical protein
MSEIHKASCLCGGVTFEVHGPLRPVIYCHCTQCRKQTGHYLASTSCAKNDLRMVQSATLAWYRASPVARRGFCNQCGSTLFWSPDKGDDISIAVGCLENTASLTAEGHIFCADKGDYYAIPDDGGYRKAQWES